MAGEYTTLGKLDAGVVFRTTDGGLYRRGDRLSGPGLEWLCEQVGKPGRVPLPMDTPVEPLDLPTLLEEHALFRRLLADAGQD